MKLSGKIKSIFKRISALLVLCALVLVFGVSALAADTVNFSKTGSITLEMEYDDEAVIGGYVTLYYVGEISYSNGGYCFTLTDDFASYTGDKTFTQSEALTDEAAQALYEYIQSNSSIEYKRHVYNSTGKITFSNLTLGLYLIAQSDDEAADGFDAFLPFLVTVPMYESGDGYVYDVTAYGKFSLISSTVEEPTTTPEEETTSPSEEETTSPSEEETTSPSEEETTSPPSEEETTSPSEEETTSPSEEETTSPSEEETTSPSEEETTSPSEEETTSPSEEETTAPEEETTAPEEETTSSEEEILPQTGSSNWLIPVMAGAGIALFILGWILKYGRRKKER